MRILLYVFASSIFILSSCKKEEPKDEEITNYEIIFKLNDQFNYPLSGDGMVSFQMKFDDGKFIDLNKVSDCSSTLVNNQGIMLNLNESEIIYIVHEYLDNELNTHIDTISTFNIKIIKDQSTGVLKLVKNDSIQHNMSCLNSANTKAVFLFDNNFF